MLALVKDILFPVHCLGCGREGELWCDQCWIEPALQRVPLAALSPLARVDTLYDYQASSGIGPLLKLFKFHGVGVEGLVTSMLKKVCFDFSATAAIVPVPLHSRRQRERGFNQAEVIGCCLARAAQLPLNQPLLQRVRATRQQAKLNRPERFENVRAAFAVRAGAPPPESVILVDDVYTTGATLTECARVLKAAGVKTVRGFVLAKD